MDIQWGFPMIDIKVLETPTNRLKPVLKWAGGKRWLVPILNEIWKPYSHRRLVEPFVGGMAVALGLQPKQALLNDINIHLINLYRWLQRGFHIDLVMENDSRFYYKCREKFNKLTLLGETDSLEAAQLFYYLNRTGYNGLCRFNSKGMFNVPFGRYKVINYIKDFSEYVPILKNWTFTTGSFSQLLLEPSDFVYADPPYDVEFTKYSSESFTWEDQIRLAEWLAKHPGPVVLSNQATERILGLYKNLGFSTEIIKGPRRISCTGDRSPALEVLAYRGLEYGKDWC